MKRGIAIQFTWIFILIVGAMLFAFFMHVIGGQKKMSEEQSSLELTRHLSNLLRRAEAGSESFNEHKVYNSLIEFECEDPQASSYSIGNKKEAIPDVVLFTQSRIKDNLLYTWNQEFSIPYRAATFIYLTSKNTKYYFLRAQIIAGSPQQAGCADFITRLYEDLPESMDKEYITAASEIRETGHNSAVVVMKRGCGNQDEIRDALDTNYQHPRTGHIVIIDDLEDNYGTVSFIGVHTYEGATTDTGREVPYYTREMMYGAVFAPQDNLYRCTVRKAFTRAKLISDLNYNRMAYLNQNIASHKGWCNNLYPMDPTGDVFTGNQYPLCGNKKIFDNLDKELAGESLQTEEQWDYDNTGQSAPCDGNALERLDDNYNRLVRATRDITLKGACPYLY